MNLADLEGWCRARGHAHARLRLVAPAVLEEHALRFNYYSETRRGAAANVEPRAGASVHGVILSVDDAGLALLDQKEGHPNRYRRRLVPVAQGGAERLAVWLYVVSAAHRRATDLSPSSEYLELLLAAAEQHGFPSDYVAAVRELGNASGESPNTTTRSSHRG
jgi:gamma-glutamylcyclotransferase (GGCT)/AIG2-like uncharacterized protein YtfP